MNAWSELLDRQKKYIDHDDESSRRHKHKLKQLYKDDLQRMIQLKEMKAYEDKQADTKIAKIQFRREEDLRGKEAQKAKELERLRREMVRDNLKTIEDKKLREYENAEKERKMYNAKYRKLMTELSEEKNSKLRQLSEEKDKVAKVLHEQMNSLEQKKHWEKEEDQKYSQLQAELAEKKEAERQRHLERIKFGYHQSAEVYEKTSNALKSQRLKKEHFLERIAVGASKDGGVKDGKELDRMTQKREVSEYNRSNFQEKRRRKRQKSFQEQLQYQEALLAEDKEERRRSEEKQQLREERKRQLQRGLLRQIEQTNRSRKINQYYLSEEESKLNHSQKKPLIHGIPRDYEHFKQQHILEHSFRSM